MASVRALNSARTWTFAGGGDLRSYLLCCFSFSQSSDKKSASKSETDAELAQYLDDIDPQMSPETGVVRGSRSPVDVEIGGTHSQSRISNAAADESTEDARTSSLLAAAEEIHPRQLSTKLNKSESGDAEVSRFSIADPPDLVKKARTDILPPGVDLKDMQYGQYLDDIDTLRLSCWHFDLTYFTLLVIFI